MAGVADKGAKRLALGIEKLHRRVLVQTVADALKREVHRPNTVACESAPGLAKIAVFVTASATFVKTCTCQKKSRPRQNSHEKKTRILKKYPSSRNPPMAQTRYEKPAKHNLNRKVCMQKSRTNESDGRISGFEGLRGLRILGFSGFRVLGF